jgi:hypothetical protein
MFALKGLDVGALTAAHEKPDSCIRTTLTVERTARSAMLIETIEASEQCAQWTGYPKTWILVDSWRAFHKPMATQ